MKPQFLIPTVLSGGLLPFLDDFNRASGALGAPWTGATYTISSNKAINTPTQGSELMANPGFEDWTAGSADAWAETSCTTAEETVDIHGGSSAMDFTATAQSGRIQQLEIVTVGDWFMASCWGKRVAGANGNTKLNVHNSSDVDGPSYTDASYTQKFLVTRARVTSIYGRPAIDTGAGTYDNVLVDDFSLKKLTLSTLFSSLSASTQDVVADVDLVITAVTQAGLVLNLDSAASPANFLIAYHDGTKARLEKCVAGTYTQLISTAAAYSANATLRVIKSGTSVELWYNGNKIGATQTVSDAGVKDNKIHGLFSTYSGNTLDNYSLVRN